MTDTISERPGRSHICIPMCRKNAHVPFRGRAIADAITSSLEAGDAVFETRREFWRESEQRWVPNVNIYRSECSMFGGVDPKKWRHRLVARVTHITDWQDGKGGR